MSEASSVPSKDQKPSADPQLDILENAPQVTGEPSQTEPQAAPPVKKDDKTDQAEQGRGFDKIRQQVQQEIGNKIRPLEAKLDQVLNQIANQGGKATQEQKAQVQSLKDDLDEIGDIDPETVDPYKVTPKLAKAMRDSLRKQNERIAALEQQQRATVQAVEPAMQTAYRQQWTRWFKQTNPDMAAKADEAFEAFEKHRGELTDPSEPVPPSTMQRIAKHAYELAVKSLSSDGGKKEPPLSSKPDKEPEGTTVVSSNSAGRAAPKGQREPTDSELIAGIITTNQED